MFYTLFEHSRTIECVKTKVTCDVGIAQCDNETNKCEKNKIK